MKKVYKLIFYSLITILLLVVIIVKPIKNQKEYFESDLFTNAEKQFDTLQLYPFISDSNLFLSGWAAENITPQLPARLVGYGFRGKHTEVLDSLFVKAIVFSNGVQKFAILSYDIMILHPSLRNQIDEAIQNSPMNFEGIYFGTVHSHTSFGHWGKDLSNQIANGKFDSQMVDHIAQQTVKALSSAINNLMPASMGYGENKLENLVKNHFGKEFYTDSILRYVKIKVKSGKTAVISSFSGHPTFLSPHYSSLSADYPGRIAQSLSENDSIDFSLFLSGAVGGHKLRYDFPRTDSLHGSRTYENLKILGGIMADSIINNQQSLFLCDCNKLLFKEISVELPDPQFRLGNKLSFRPWFFNLLMGKHKAKIQYFQLGDIHFISTPGDVSGEFYENLQPILNTKGEKLFLTGLNGDYIGYIIPEKHYSSTQSEAREMNWYGPYLGTHFEHLIKELIKKNESVY